MCPVHWGSKTRESMPRKTKKSSHKPPRGNVQQTASARVVILAMYDYHLAEDNGKHGLVGIFDTLGAKQFPTPFTFYLFVKATAAPGHHAAKIELREKANNKLIFQLPFFEFDLPTQPVAYQDLVTQVNIRFPAPGSYEWRVYLDDALRGLYSFQV